MEFDSKRQFLKEGDVVKLKQNIPNAPIMIVDRIVRLPMPSDASPKKGNTLLGIQCFWFDSTGALHTKRFNCKDLIQQL